MKVFCGGIGTESNGFVSMPTPLRDFDEHTSRGVAGRYPDDMVHSAAYTWQSLARERGLEFVPGLLAWAMPSGPTTRHAYEALRTELLDGLRAAMPVDAVLLDLHGAMVADGYPDAEGDLIESVRRVVGPDVAIGVHLDLHCHLTRKMVQHATVIITMKEWPHVDVPERAREILDLVTGASEGRLRPRMSLYDCRMIATYPTRREPMRTFVDALFEAEREQGILSVSVAHGFPWADVPEIGTKVLVISDENPDRGAELAATIGGRLWDTRREVTEWGDMELDEALDYALDADELPVVLCEQCDSHLGGTAGDGTYILRRVIERGIGNVVFGPIWDPMGVDICSAVGEGAHLTLRVGGKAGPESGLPVDLDVTVRKLIPDLRQEPLGDIAAFDFGDAVWVSTANDLDLVLHTRRAGTLRPNVILDFGIDLAAKQIAVCKMWRHGQHGFLGVARDFKILRTPGAQTLDYAAIPFAEPVRPYWPLVEDPFG